MVGRFVVDLVRDVLRNKDDARSILIRHGIQCVPVLIWVIGVCGMPLWLYAACFVYPGMSLAMVRSFAEHRAAPEPNRRTAIVENARLLGPLFLFNNLHVAHHLRGGLPWYQIPTFYRLNRAALIERNGGLVYNSYFDVARRYLLRPHRPTRSSRLGRPLRMSLSASAAALPMYDFPETAAANDAFWAAIASRLNARGVEAPAELTRGADLRRHGAIRGSCSARLAATRT